MGAEIVNLYDPEGKVIWPGVSKVEEFAWEDLGDITSSQAALGAGAMDDASVEALTAAKRVIWTPEKRPIALDFRFEMDGSANDTSVIQLYARADRVDSSGNVQVDEYTRVATLTLTQGTQEGNTASTFFADNIAEAAFSWGSASRAIQVSGGDNHIARWRINKHGEKKFCFIASTLSVTTIHVWGRRL